VAREARVVLELVDGRDLEMVLHAFEYAGGGPFDVERGKESIECYVDAPEDPAAVAQEALRFLFDQGLANLIAPPPRIERWNGDLARYVDPDAPPVHSEPLTDVRWRVTVWPTDFFDWRKARAELERRQRPPLRETRKILEIPAADEADALALAAMLRQISGLGPMKIEKLGRFRGWLARERLFGGYAEGGGGGG
jgi:hypothetical protein